MAEQTTEKDRKPQQQDDDVVGKAYDSRLMGRLLTYLRPYKLQAAISLVAILLKAGFDVLGPYLTKVAVDRYISYRRGKDIVTLSVFLLKDQPIEEHEFHVIVPEALLAGARPVAEIRPTATAAQKQSADGGLAFKDLPSAAASFDAVLAKITA